ncbi:hypothetical protein AB0N09_41790 [Streptomyces erythrochromogenes]|uniref:hypothetical protein n=1 Tax=Streptomyces erythrochromogenes TaxID=285574 RepID=UPI00341AFB0F
MRENDSDRFDDDAAGISLAGLIRQADALVPAPLESDLRRRKEQLVAWMTADVDPATETDSDVHLSVRMNTEDPSTNIDSVPPIPSARSTGEQSPPTELGQDPQQPPQQEPDLFRIQPSSQPPTRAPRKTGRRYPIAPAMWQISAAAAAAAVGLLLALGGTSTPDPDRSHTNSQPNVVTSPPHTRPQGLTTHPTPAGHWIVQLASIPKTDGEPAREQNLAVIRRKVPTARVLDSDQYASLRPGYWVVYDPGPYATGADAVAFCHEAGLNTRNNCRGRYLSPRPEDSTLVCEPDVAVQPQVCRNGLEQEEN